MKSSSSPWKNLTHIGVVVRDIERSLQAYREFGIGPFRCFDLPSEEFIKFRWRHHFGKPADSHVYKVAWGIMSPIALEVFQPITGDSIPQRVLDSRGEGIWHYGYDVENMNNTVTWMEHRGYPVVGAAEAQDGTLMCYFDTIAAGGVYFQAHEVPATSTLYADLAKPNQL